MEHIKLICLSDKCLILNPDQKPTKAFINNLIEQLRCVYKDYVKINGVASMRMLYQRNTQAREIMKIFYNTWARCNFNFGWLVKFLNIAAI